MARRPSNVMPDGVAERLCRAGVMDDYEARPRYQRNDYIGWIGRAKRDETRESRINQMIEELRLGGVYMKMSHPPSAKL